MPRISLAHQFPLCPNGLWIYAELHMKTTFSYVAVSFFFSLSLSPSPIKLIVIKTCGQNNWPKHIRIFAICFWKISSQKRPTFETAKQRPEKSEDDGSFYFDEGLLIESINSRVIGFCLSFCFSFNVLFFLFLSFTNPLSC